MTKTSRKIRIAILTSIIALIMLVVSNKAFAASAEEILTFNWQDNCYEFTSREKSINTTQMNI